MPAWAQIHPLMESSVHGEPSQAKHPAGVSPAECDPSFTACLPPLHGQAAAIQGFRSTSHHFLFNLHVSTCALLQVLQGNFREYLILLWPGLPINQGTGRTWEDWANHNFNLEKCLNINQNSWRLSRSSIFFESLVCLVFFPPSPFFLFFIFFDWPCWAEFYPVPLGIFLSGFRRFLWGTAPSDAREILLVRLGRG